MSSEENKQLLLADLCGRLPYGVNVHVMYESSEPCYGKLSALDIEWFINSKIKTIKPYLRPMSSMTKEERNEYLVVCTRMLNNSEFYAYQKTQHLPVDWLNAHHMDYRGLIEKGLAFEAPEGMYDEKE